MADKYTDKIMVKIDENTFEEVALGTMTHLVFLNNSNMSLEEYLNSLNEAVTTLQDSITSMKDELNPRLRAIEEALGLQTPEA